MKMSFTPGSLAVNAILKHQEKAKAANERHTRSDAIVSLLLLLSRFYRCNHFPVLHDLDCLYFLRHKHIFFHPFHPFASLFFSRPFSVFGNPTRPHKFTARKKSLSRTRTHPARRA